MRWPEALALALLTTGPLGSAATKAAGTSCVSCHDDAGLFAPESLAHAQAAGEGAHADVSISCHDCHGGNPDPVLSEDPLAAMDPTFEGNPYRGAPSRVEVPAFCGRCHSDPGFMRRYRPAARVDQEQEYRTSFHGIALARGDARVATCTDCHGSHGIRRVVDPRSSVHPSRVAETCGRCHSDATVMTGSTLPDGRPLPIDQQARWTRSVHARALVEKEDLSAPTCNDCHGNHGAAPPGLDSIAFVCGQCHPREAELFRSSPKREGFDRHNAYLAQAGSEGCQACHEGLPVQAEAAQLRSLFECSACHGHHDVVAPSTVLLAPLPETPCFFCHEGPRAQELQEPEDLRQRYQLQRDTLLAAAEASGLQGDARYDWLVEQAKKLPFHTVPGSVDGPLLRREFALLFEKFRIGKTHHDDPDPASGGEVLARLTRCDDCHVSQEPGSGLSVSAELLGRMQELSAKTASAERILLRARRGGVQTGRASAEVDGAVSSEIKLQALVHDFRGGETSAFGKEHAVGMAHAEAAVDAGRRALTELSSRRKVLAVSLAVIAAVLWVLAREIRRVGRERAARAVRDDEDRSS